MAINFNQNSVFNLKPINPGSVRGEVQGLLINGEEVIISRKYVPALKEKLRGKKS